MVKGTPYRPTRVWRYKIGRPLVTAIAIAITNRSGASNTRLTVATTKSNTRLTSDLSNVVRSSSGGTVRRGALFRDVLCATEARCGDAIPLRRVDTRGRWSCDSETASATAFVPPDGSKDA